MIPRDTTACGITDFWVVSLWWYHELVVFYWWNQAQARAGGIILVVSYWWNHSIRCLLARDASPCSVNPNLIAEHELLHDCQPSIFNLKKIRASILAFKRAPTGIRTWVSRLGVKANGNRANPSAVQDACGRCTHYHENELNTAYELKAS